MFIRVIETDYSTPNNPIEKVHYIRPNDVTNIGVRLYISSGKDKGIFSFFITQGEFETIKHFLVANT